MEITNKSTDVSISTFLNLKLTIDDENHSDSGIPHTVAKTLCTIPEETVIDSYFLDYDHESKEIDPVIYEAYQQKAMEDSRDLVPVPLKVVYRKDMSQRSDAEISGISAKRTEFKLAVSAESKRIVRKKNLEKDMRIKDRRKQRESLPDSYILSPEVSYEPAISKRGSARLAKALERQLHADIVAANSSVKQMKRNRKHAARVVTESLVISEAMYGGKLCHVPGFLKQFNNRPSQLVNILCNDHEESLMNMAGYYTHDFGQTWNYHYQKDVDFVVFEQIMAEAYTINQNQDILPFLSSKTSTLLSTLYDYDPSLAQFSRRLELNDADEDLIDQLRKIFKDVIAQYDLGIYADLALDSAVFMYLLFREEMVHKKILLFHLWMSRIGINKKYKYLTTCSISALTAIFTSFRPKAKVQTESLSDHLHNLSEMLSFVLESNVVVAVRNLVISLACLHLFKKDVAGMIYQQLGRPTATDNLSLIQMILKDLACVVAGFERLMAGMSLSKILFSDDPVAVALVEATDLIQKQENVFQGLPVPGYMSLKDYVAKCDQVLSVLNNVVSKGNMFKPGYTNCATKANTLTNIVAAKRAQLMQGTRIPPIVFVVSGPPGTGKSSIVSWLFSTHARAVGRVFHHGLVYVKTMTSEYHEGYDPWSNPYMHMSEPGAKARALAQKMGDPGIDELTTLADSLPTNLNMAFSGKGKTPFLCEVIVLDTNNPSFNLDVLYENPAAYRRRFIYVTHVVKPEYRKETGNELDPSKTSARLMDKFLFSFHKEEAQSNKKSARVSLLEDADVDTAATYLKKYILNYLKVQTDVLNQRHSDMNVPYGLPEEMPKVLQSFPDPISIPEMHVDPLPMLDEKGDVMHFHDDEMPAMDETKDFLDSFTDEKGDVPDGGVQTESLMGDIKNAIVPELDAFKTDMLLKWQFVKNLPNFLFYSGELTKEVGVNLFNLAAFELMTYFKRPSIIPPQYKTWIYIMCFILFFVSHLIPGGHFLWLGLALLVGISVYFDLYVVSIIYRSRTDMRTKLYNSAGNWMDYMNVAVPLRPAVRSTYLFYLVGACTIMAAVFGTGAVFKAYFNKSKKSKMSIRREEVVPVVPETTPASTVSPIVPTVQTQDMTMFRIDAPENQLLNQHELLADATHARKFIRNNEVPQTWVILPEKDVLPVHAGPVQDLAKSTSNNVREAIVKVDGKNYSRTHIFGVKGAFALVNTHAIPATAFDIYVNYSGNPEDEENFVETKIDFSRRFDLSYDVSILQLSKFQFKDIRKHICSLDFKSARGYIFGEEVEVLKCDQPLLAINEHIGELEYKEVVCYESSKHAQGRCGIPLYISFGGKSYIYGIHAAGERDGNLGYAIPFPAKEVQTFFEERKKNPPVAMDIVSEADCVVTLGAPPKKSLVRHEPMGSVEYRGHDGKPVLAKGKSRLQKTLIAPYLPELMKVIGVEAKTVFAPPHMSAFRTQDGEWRSPYNYNFRNIRVPTKDLKPETVDAVISFMTKKIVSGLREVGEEKWAPLTFQETINGSLNDPFLRRVNASTGAGFGFPGKKDKYMPIVSSDDEREVIREITPDIKRTILKRLDEYNRDMSSGAVYATKLKDEPRDIKKVEIGKTRMFYPSSLPDLLLARQVLAPFYTAMVKYGNVFRSAVGINMFSDAETLFKDLSGFGTKVFQGDIGGYDTKMAYAFRLISSSVQFNVCREMGYNEVALRQLRGVLSDDLAPILEILGDFFVKPGVMPSGKYGTAESNCITTSAMILCYAYEQGVPLEDVDKFIRYITYGDDVTGTVSEEGTEWFDNVKYAKWLMDAAGMEFTSPDKNTALKRWYELDEMNFLKRFFRKHPQFGNIKAVLDMESIYKMLTWTIPSDYVSSRDQLESTINSALWELYQYYDQSKFNEIRDWFIRILQELNLKLSIVTFGRIAQTLDPTAMVIREEESLVVPSKGPLYTVV